MKYWKRRRQSILLAALGMVLCATSALPLYATDEKPTGEVALSAFNHYIWRGYELSRDSLVVQPSLTIAYKGFSANIWGNLDTDPYSGGGGRNYGGTWNETDYTLSYTKTVGLFNMGVGYIYYSLNALNSDTAPRPDSQEVFASLGLNTILSPTLTVYNEIAHYRNWYFLLGVSHAFELNKMLSLKLAATASYLLSTDERTYPEFNSNALPTSRKFSNLHDGTLSASLPIKATSSITLTPTVSYVFPLSHDAKNEMKGFGLRDVSPAKRDSSFIVGGLTASFAF